MAAQSADFVSLGGAVGDTGPSAACLRTGGLGSGALGRGAMTQGYITLATGSRAYYDMAENLAASIRVMDPGRLIALAHDHDAVISPAARRLFDYLIPLPKDPKYVTVTKKFQLLKLSPFNRTMFVDADCLMVKRDIDRYWAIAAKSFFTIPGNIRISGSWKGKNIADLMHQEGVDHVVEVNAGVFTFDKSERACAFFAGLNAFYLDRKEALVVNTHAGTRKYSDEMFFSIYMAKCGVRPWNRAESMRDSWMVTTYRSLVLHANPKRGKALILKPTGYLFDLPLLPTGLTCISPTFAHFVGRKPAGVYARLSSAFRKEAFALLDGAEVRQVPAGLPA